MDTQEYREHSSSQEESTGGPACNKTSQTTSVMNDLLLLVVRPGITRRVLKTTDLNEEDKDTEGQYSDQDLKQYKDKDVEQPNGGSCT